MYTRDFHAHEQARERIASFTARAGGAPEREEEARERAQDEKVGRRVAPHTNAQRHHGSGASGGSGSVEEDATLKKRRRRPASDYSTSIRHSPSAQQRAESARHTTMVTVQF